MKPSNCISSQVSIHTDLEQAFKGADVILLLDECWSDDGETEDEEEKKKKKQVKRISDRYRTYGQLIDTRANKEVKVMVSGDSFVNLRCSLLLDNARSIDSYRFISMATQLENEARAIVAKKLKVKTSGSYCINSDVCIVSLSMQEESFLLLLLLQMLQTSSCGETSVVVSTLTCRRRKFSTMMVQSKDRLSSPNQSERFSMTGL